ncbi:dihydroorotase [Verrucomicrobiota bacterium]
MQNTWHIKNGRIIDPLTSRDEIADLYIKNGIISKPDKTGSDLEKTNNVIDARGFVVVPGFIDMHVHFREPGNEESETVESGSKAAARGGFTSVLMMPNTTPPLDTGEKISEILDTGGTYPYAHVMTAGCITKNRQGKELANLTKMKKAGAVTFTDDGATVADENLMRLAMKTAKELKTAILDHALDPALAGKGVMHEGSVSAQLKLPGIPTQSEVNMVQRDIRLAEETGCHIHIQHVSAKETVELIRKALDRGLPVSGEATPHHLALIDSDINPKNTNFKMNPPLRTSADRTALLSAVADGTLRILATDHAPHSHTGKTKSFLDAPFGVVGLETAIGTTYTLLVKNKLMSLADWIDRWTVSPAHVLNLEPPALSPGQKADITILDLNTEWTIHSNEFASKSTNTPFEGRKITGRPIYTFCNGIMTYGD